MTEDRFRVPDSVLRAPVSDNEVLLNPQTQIYHLVEGSGRFVLEQLESGLAVGEVASRLADRFGIDTNRALADVRAFVSDMCDRGLLVLRK